MNPIYNSSDYDQASHQLMRCLLDQLDVPVATPPDVLDDDMRYKLCDLESARLSDSAVGTPSPVTASYIRQ